MDVAIIDYFANSGRSFLHRASSIPKIIFVALVITSVVIIEDLLVLLSIYTTLLTLAVWTRLPVLKIVVIASYPAVFALLFAFASWTGSWTRAGVIILKALDAALAMVLLIVTTPYPKIFASIKPFLPDIIAEALFITYRSLFMLLELTDALLRALRIRGGISKRRYLKNISNFGSGIGLLLVRGIDLSEKLYIVMNVRGYRGELSTGEEKTLFSSENLATASLGALILTLSLTIDYGENWSRFGIYVLLLSGAVFLGSSFYIKRLSVRGAYERNR